MPQYFLLYFFGGMMLLGIGFWYINKKMEKRRTEAWRQAADEMGFAFDPKPGKAFLSRFPAFNLLSQGSSRTVKNLIQGKALGLELDIFDYAYTTGSGKNRHTWLQTVLAFEIDGSELPTFSLRPESIIHKIGQWFGYQDIDFESHPRFSRKYLLRGQREDAIRELFQDHVLEYYESSPGCCTEGSGNRLLYYRASQRIAPANVRAFMEDGFRVLALFRPPSKDSGK